MEQSVGFTNAALFVSVGHGRRWIWPYEARVPRGTNLTSARTVTLFHVEQYSSAVELEFESNLRIGVWRRVLSGRLRSTWNIQRLQRRLSIIGGIVVVDLESQDD